MSTKAQIKANQQNAQKSTGPQTAEGKAAVSQNAVKHGLFAESVINGENPADYELYHDQFLAELAPVGMVESMLAGRFVSLSWRLQRAERIQNQAIDVMIARDEPSPLSKQLHRMLPRDLQEVDIDTRGAGPELVLGRAVITDLSNSRSLERLMMYERRIENSMIKIMKELKRCQIMRRIEQQDADEQPVQAIPKRGTGFQPVENMARTGPKACGFEAATRRPPTEKQGDLKKQSQFLAPTLTKGAGKIEKSLTAATG